MLRRQVLKHSSIVNYTSYSQQTFKNCTKFAKRQVATISGGIIDILNDDFTDTQKEVRV